MKKVLLLIFAMAFSLNVIAQLEIKEDSFKEVEGFVNTNLDKQTDANNKPYSIIKIKTENIENKHRRELVLEGNSDSFFELEYKVGEIWVYVTYSTTYIKISHPELGSTEFWLPFDMEPHKCYDLTLIDNPVVREEIANKPENAEIKQNNSNNKKRTYVKFNISIGLTKQKPIQSYYGGNPSNPAGYYLGFSMDLEFKNGIGMELGEFGYNLYSYKFNQYDIYDSSYSDHKHICNISSIYFSPIKLKYTVGVCKNKLGIYAATGLSLEQWVSFKDEYIGGDGVIYYIGNTQKNLYYCWDIKLGMTYRFLKLSVGTNFILNKRLNIGTAATNNIIDQDPYYLVLSIML